MAGVVEADLDTFEWVLCCMMKEGSDVYSHSRLSSRCR